MITYRTFAGAVVGCLTGLSLAACSVGLTSPASPPGSPASSPAASSTAQAASSSSAPPVSSSSAAPASSAPAAAAGSGSALSVGGSIGSFPIPPGATGVVNGNTGGAIDVVLSGVAPSAVDSFYTAALPQAGYTITSNAQATAFGIGTAGIEFTGHGYKGEIGDANGIIGITFTPQ